MSAEGMEGSKSRTLGPKSGCAFVLGDDWATAVAVSNKSPNKLRNANDGKLEFKLARSVRIADMAGLSEFWNAAT